MTPLLGAKFALILAIAIGVLFATTGCGRKDTGLPIDQWTYIQIDEPSPKDRMLLGHDAADAPDRRLGQARRMVGTGHVDFLNVLDQPIA